MALNFAWEKPSDGCEQPSGCRWVIFNTTDHRLEVCRCSVSENPHSLPRPPTGIAILWVSPSITDEQAIQRASHSDVYYALLRSNVNDLLPPSTG